MIMIGKRFNLFFLFIFIVNAFVVNLHAEILVNSKISKTDVALNENITYQLIISGSTEEGSFSKRIFKDFTIVSEGRNQSFRYTNGNFESTIIKSFVLKPKAVGQVTIPEAKVIIKNKEYLSRPFSIEVKEARTASSSGSQLTPPQSNRNSSSQMRRPVQTQNSELLLVAETDKTTAYVGEEIIYKLFLLRQVSIMSDIRYSLPEFNNMISEPLQRDDTSFRKVINGERYYIQEIDRRSLFSYESGAISILPAEANLRVSFYTQSLASNQLNLTILPLPKKNVPASFTGLVGDFTLESRIPEGAFIQNTPIVVKFILKGRGNLKHLNSLSFKENQYFKILQSSVEDFIEAKDNLSGERHFEFIIVPKKSGTYNVPIFSLSYFSPTEKTYKTIQTDPYAIEIIQAEQAPITQQIETNNLEFLNADLRYLKQVDLNARNKQFIFTLFFIGVFILNIFFLIINLLSYLVKLSWFQQLIQVFNIKSHEKALKSLDLLQAKQLSLKQLGTEIQQILLDYLSINLKQSIHGLVYSDLAAIMKKQHYPTKTILKITKFLESCSFVAYSPGTKGASVEKKLLKEAKSLIKELKLK